MSIDFEKRKKGIDNIIINKKRNQLAKENVEILINL